MSTGKTQPPGFDPQRTLRELPSILPSSRPTANTEAKYVLVVMNGPQIGDRRAVDPRVRIGRDPASDLALRDPSVSWLHAEVRVEGQRLVLHDQSSRHGSFVNGKRVEGPIELGGGDDIEIGKTQLRVELHGPAELLFDRAVLARLERDDLTGLMTRRKFDSELEGKLLSATQSAQPLALLLFDLDGLKRVNDAHGHACGAEVIRAVGEMLRERMGAQAIGCRFGGDEFAIAVSNADEPRAFAIAAELLSAVAATEIQWHGEAISVRASSGVAVVEPHAEITVTEVFARADRALFAAKHLGGNRVVRASTLPPAR